MARMMSLARPRALERDSAMTLLALRSELTRVHIILRMARYTLRAELDLICRLRVAAFALQFCVGTVECESGLLAMVELP